MHPLTALLSWLTLLNMNLGNFLYQRFLSIMKITRSINNLIVFCTLFAILCLSMKLFTGTPYKILQWNKAESAVKARMILFRLATSLFVIMPALGSQDDISYKEYNLTTKVSLLYEFWEFIILVTQQIF